MSSGKRKNQHKPCPPIEDVLPIIQKYYNMNRNDKQIQQYILDEIDQSLYSISVSTIKRIRKENGLLSTRQQKHTVESIRPFIVRLRVTLTDIGAGEMVQALFTNFKIKVSHGVVLQYFHKYEPEALTRRKQRKLRRKRFWATGVNDFWAFDQHDKWKRFGLRLHLGMEVASGKILWLRVWWSNRRTALIASYYLDVVRELGYVCLVTQSDQGGENYGIAKPHTTIRQHLDPSLAGTIQHRWTIKGGNVKPEIKWSGFRRSFSPGFEDLLEAAVQDGIYIPEDKLHMFVFRWLVIPWMQLQLDNYIDRHNSRLPRHNKKKFLPHGIPNIIFERAQDYGLQDFKVVVPPELLDAVTAEYAPRTDPAFELVPPWFDQKITAAYNTLEQRDVTEDTLWYIFSSLQAGLRATLSDRELDVVYGVQIFDDEDIDFSDQIMPGTSVPWPAVEYEDNPAGGDGNEDVPLFSEDEDDDDEGMPWAVFTDLEDNVDDNVADFSD